MDGGAPLPWGRPNAGATQIELQLPAKMGLTQGTRVEVKWLLEDEETRTKETKWWAGVLAGKVPDEFDGEGRHCYLIRYDADIDEGFDDQEDTIVSFIDDHSIYDKTNDLELSWRLSGSDWDDAPQPLTNDTVRLGEVDEAMQRHERLRGQTYEQEAIHKLQQLPPEQQRVVAENFRNFTETMTKGIAALQEKNGPDYVVQEEDVQEVVAQFKKDSVQ